MNADNAPVQTIPVPTPAPVPSPAPAPVSIKDDPEDLAIQRDRNQIMRDALTKNVEVAYSRDELRLQAALAVARAGNPYYFTPKSVVKFGNEFADEWLATRQP